MLELHWSEAIEKKLVHVEDGIERHRVQHQLGNPGIRKASSKRGSGSGV